MSFILIAAVTGIFLWWCLSPAKNPLVETASFGKPKDENALVTVSKIGESSSATNGTLQMPPTVGPLGDPATAEEVKYWFAERGNFNFFGFRIFG